MSGDSRGSQTERDEDADVDADEDAWYRALRAKAGHRFPDPGEERAEAPTPAPPERTADGDD